MAGRRQDAVKVLDHLEELSKQHYVAPVYAATVYVGLGEYDQAMDLYEKSYEQRSWGMLWLKIGHNLKPLRGTARFEALLKKMNFPPEPQRRAAGLRLPPQAHN